MKPIYLDYNATTPIDPLVANAMMPFLKDHFGNPSSTHWFGHQARQAVEKAREQVAHCLSCNPEEIIFSSGGTESNNMALKGMAYALRGKGNEIIISAIEHPAVIEVCHYLENQGFRIIIVSVDGYGMVDPADVERHITPATILVSIMHANNETGTIQPIRDIAAITRRHGVVFHTDAAQSVGKIPVNVKELGVDLLSIAGHKLYAPKGIGALYIRQGIQPEKLIHGANHERNLRAGTENVLEIAGLGMACQVAAKNLEANARQMKKTRDLLHQGLLESFPSLHLNGHPEHRLPNTLNVSFPGIEAQTILSAIPQIAASAGAACHSDKMEISAVLTAMKVPLQVAMGTIRFSTGKTTTEAVILKAIGEIKKVITPLMTKTGQTSVEVSQGADEVRLTQFTHGLGCACKIRPQYLENVLQALPAITGKEILVGPQTSDDAAVYMIDEETAIVQTVDFFTPIVDDPYDFGAIAAANALSDIYAMGGRPLFALNIVGFPDNRLPVSVLHRILQGAADKAHEAGIEIPGGHTVEDTEPKYGLVVTGVVHPQKVLRNSTAQPGDAIILTKPIGTGIITTAAKGGQVPPQLLQKAISWMKMLNQPAAERMAMFRIHACTDVTGFGLLGHLREMTQSAGIDAEICLSDIPVMDGVRQLALAGFIPGGTRNNLEYIAEAIRCAPEITETDKLILADAQTSGGLLIAVAPAEADQLMNDFSGAHVSAALIGHFTEPGEGHIHISF